MTALHRCLAANVKALRHQHQWSQARLAEQSEVSVSYIGDIEVARKWPSADHLEKLARALGCRSWELLMEPVDRSEYHNYLESYSLIARIADQLGQSIKEKVDSYLSEKDK